MEVKILGYRRYDFIDKESNNRVQGVSVYIAYYDPDVTGRFCSKVSITNPELWKALVNLVGGKATDLVDYECIFHYNNRGKFVGASAK